MDTTPAINSGIHAINNAVNPIISQSNTPAIGASVNPLQITIGIYECIWILGIAVMLLYAAISFIRLQKRVRASLYLRDNIWICDDIQTPFILGVFKPRIYIPSGTDEAQLPHIIAHENAHLKRRDHWWKPLGFLVLAIHWFNPLVWLAYILLCRDIELACDEKVIRELNQGESIAYSEALLSCSVNRKMVMVCPLAFGEVGVKERVKRVLNYKKPAFWIVVVAVIASVALAVCFLTNPKALGDSITLIKQSTPVRGNAFTYDVSFGQNVMSGTVHAEQWSNGTCVKSSPIVLTNEVDEINILMNVRRENNSPVGVDIQVDTNEYGGSLITYFAFPENNSIIGWGCKSYELNEPVQIHPDTEKILAALVFDVGNGVRAFGTEDLIIEPERLTNADYAIVIRAEFDSTNLGKDNNEATPIYSTFSATVLEIHDGYYLVEPMEGSWELSSADRIEVPIRNAVPSPEPEVGDVIEIEYSGDILESYPAQIANVYGIKVISESDIAENELFEAFYNSKEYNETVHVTGYVFAYDGAFGLDGIIQYEDESGSPWKLAFIHDGLAYPVSQTWDSNHVIVGELIYLGNGRVKVYVENTETGILYECSMAYSYDEEARNTHFESVSNEINENGEVVYKQTPIDQIEANYNNEEYVITKLHYENLDGEWVCGEHTYKYRLEITGRLNNAAKNTTYIVLSNTEDITFDQTWKASGLSSNLNDYFDPSVAVIVGNRLFS